MVEDLEAGPEGWVQEIKQQDALFYAYDGLIASVQL